MPDGSLGGVLAWYSLIHTDPERMGRRSPSSPAVLGPDGGLAIGFFAGPRLEPFDHAMITAYHWPVGLLVAKVAAAGFAVTHIESRSTRPDRTHGAILATRRTA
ncbi:MAG: hypothetical protein QM804_19395 [Propionicimonas sp.]